MDKKPYETPEVQTLGRVQELTRQIGKCQGSADTFFPREPPEALDAVCVIDEVA